MGKAISITKCVGCVGTILPSFLVVAILGGVSSPLARDYKVDGGLSVGYEHYDRQYEKESNLKSASDAGGATTTTDPSAPRDDKYVRFRVAPLVVVSAISARDEASLRYSPGFRYDYESYDHDVDHDLSAQIKRYITRNWQLRLTEKYLLTDAVLDQNATQSKSSVQLSENTGRRKYWTNDVGFISEYTYWEDSLFSLGYTNTLLENLDVDTASGYQNYNRHESSLSVAHRLDSIWKMTATAKYVRGLYDSIGEKETIADDETIDQDLNEYRASTTLESSLLAHHPLSLTYGFLAVDYDDTTRDSSYLNDVTLGWQWDISKEFRVSLGGGPSYQVTDGQTGNWGYNANAGLKYTFEHSAIGMTASHGYDRQNFSGTNENGLQEYWQARVDYQYEILKDWTLKVLTNYRYEDQEEITSQSVVPSDSGAANADSQVTTETEIFNRQRFAVGTSTGYRFWRWYTLNLSYDYLLQDSEKVNDSYDEHRLILSLLMEKDLFNW